MSGRIPVRHAAVWVLLLTFLIGFTANGSAAPIELPNDATVQWSDAPCQFGPAQLCKPLDELIRILGAPRLVPDAANAGSLLDIAVDFLGVSLDANPFLPGNKTPLILNVYDLQLNPVLGPGSKPLELTYLISPSGGLSVPANDLFLSLGDFNGYGLLPTGDLIFTVEFHPKMGITDHSPDRPGLAAVIALSGVGSTEIPVPEPSTLVLLLFGVAITGLAARSRRFSRRRSIG